MAALRWVVHSACHVLGYTTKDTNSCTPSNQMASAVGYPNHQANIVNGDHHDQVKSLQVNSITKEGLSSNYPSGFQMPLHYPRYSKADYEKMDEWRLDTLLMEYGLNFKGTLYEKREYAKGAFLWPDQY
ncbi:uncharacterized protein LOC115707288 [Cannabis sativa]|uniref:DUF7722 domain-containing protein n=2 Tax=Cannabis sativa TaxID=3483 RepID=A0A7J6HW45_CANSA|nr:uncharacterized protein LOC115707288 [Cannabis sativa]KAF4368788.1 hypothetical protein F8388_021400 [Cannabis sativa]KAF4399482.1 hypothetical protein G4B88_022565 [Cannabis sativa]